MKYLTPVSQSQLPQRVSCSPVARDMLCRWRSTVSGNVSGRARSSSSVPSSRNALTPPWEAPKATIEQLSRAEIQFRVRHLDNLLWYKACEVPAALLSCLDFAESHELQDTMRSLVRDKVAVHYWMVRPLEEKVEGLSQPNTRRSALEVAIPRIDAVWQIYTVLGESLDALRNIAQQAFNHGLNQATNALRLNNDIAGLKYYLLSQALGRGKALDTDAQKVPCQSIRKAIDTLVAPQKLDYDATSSDATELAARSALALHSVNTGSHLEALNVAHETLVYAEAIGMEVPQLLSSRFPLVIESALAAIHRGIHPAALQERRTARLLNQSMVLAKALHDDEAQETLQFLAPYVLAKLVASVDRRLAKSSVSGSRAALAYTHRFAAEHGLGVGNRQVDCITQMQVHQIHQAFCRLRRADLSLHRPHAGTWVDNKLEQHNKYQGVFQPIAHTYSKVQAAERHMSDVVIESILLAERIGQRPDAFRQHLHYSARPQGSAVDLTLLIDPHAAITVPSEASLLRALLNIDDSDMLFAWGYQPLLPLAQQIIELTDLVEPMAPLLTLAQPLAPTPALQDTMALLYIAAMCGRSDIVVRDEGCTDSGCWP